MQGITGLLFIDLAHIPGLPRDAETPTGREYPVIRSIPSDFDRLIAGMPSLVADATRVTQQLNKLLADGNIESLSATLRHIETTSASLPEAVRAAGVLIHDTRGLVAELRETTRGAGRLIGSTGPQLDAAMGNLKLASDALAAASGRIDGLLARNEGSIDDFAGRGLGEVTALAAESRAAAAEVRELARSLREDPSRLLYQSPGQGVEMPR
jgi:phospholipid/cholesterol/gamma-HCH transport system substrate-binding protein